MWEGGRNLEIIINGKCVRYIDQGSGSQTILLLHGWGVDGNLYHLLTDHLSAYCRVLVPDLPGFGGSEEPDRPYTPADFADFVLAFAEALGVTEVIGMGHSNGGRILIELLARDRCPLTVKKAILLDSAGIPAKHSLPYYLRVYTFKCIKHVAALPGIRSLFPNAVEKAQKRFGSADYKQASPVMRQSMVIALKTDVTPLLSRIRVPTLLIWGKDDTATPLRDAKIMEQHIPDAGLVVLAGGHYAFAESFGQCRRVLDSFLQGE